MFFSLRCPLLVAILHIIDYKEAVPHHSRITYPADAIHAAGYLFLFGGRGECVNKPSPTSMTRYSNCIYDSFKHTCMHVQAWSAHVLNEQAPEAIRGLFLFIYD
jgi:hypothetical protein